jgi:hypothetical protein
MSKTNLVPLPCGSGWHFIRVDQIVAVKFMAVKKTVVHLAGDISVEVSEDTHVVRKRIEDFISVSQQEPSQGERLREAARR